MIYIIPLLINIIIFYLIRYKLYDIVDSKYVFSEDKKQYVNERVLEKTKTPLYLYLIHIVFSLIPYFNIAYTVFIIWVLGKLLTSGEYILNFKENKLVKNLKKSISEKEFRFNVGCSPYWIPNKLCPY
jgi:hypothetical protein